MLERIDAMAKVMCDAHMFKRTRIPMSVLMHIGIGMSICMYVHAFVFREHTEPNSLKMLVIRAVEISQCRPNRTTVQHIGKTGC